MLREVFIKNLGLFSILFLFSCSNSAENSVQTVSEVDQTAAVKDGVSKSEPAADKSLIQERYNQKLIKTGYLKLEVNNLGESRKKIESYLKKCGGYFGNESEQNETYQITNELTLRIPTASFDEFMEFLIKEGIKTELKRIEVQDVSEEYTDVSARIIAKKAIEKRYLDLLQKANKITEILEIEEKLRVINEEKEVALARQNYLDNQISYSTINLTLFKTIDANYVPPSGPGFFSRIGEGLGQGWQGVLNVGVAISYLWPLWIILLIGFFILKNRVRKGRKLWQKNSQ